MSDSQNEPRRPRSLAEQLATGEKVPGGAEADVRERPHAFIARPANPPVPQPKSESAPSGDAIQDLERNVRSMLAQALGTVRGPNVICFIPKDRRPKWIGYPAVPEFEGNEFGTVLVFQSTSANIEIRGRNLLVLAQAASFGHLETVRISDGNFANNDAYVTDILFHPPEPGRLHWSERGEYLPRMLEELTADAEHHGKHKP
jgi:hypothetical protein